MSKEELFSKINIALTRINNSTSIKNETYIDKEVLQELLNYIDKLQQENGDNYCNFIKEKNKAEKMLIHYTNEKERADKLQEENKELKQDNEDLQQINKKQWLFTFKHGGLDSLEQVDNDFISKDVIKNKIKEYRENIEIFKKLGKTDYIVINECKILGLEELL